MTYFLKKEEEMYNGFPPSDTDKAFCINII
jgi:hypothetical protein